MKPVMRAVISLGPCLPMIAGMHAMAADAPAPSPKPPTIEQQQAEILQLTKQAAYWHARAQLLQHRLDDADDAIASAAAASATPPSSK